MRIENEMLSRFSENKMAQNTFEENLSMELDYFFNNVIDTVADYFTEKEEVLNM